MKKSLSILLFALCVLPLGARAGTAQARLTCQSIRFYPDNYGGFYDLDSLRFTSINNGYNGEFWPYGGAYTHGSSFELYSFLYEESFTGQIVIDTPSPQDANNNGFDDFFEVSQAVSASTSGEYSYGNVQVQWSRAAGSSFGICSLTLDMFGPFEHTFEILEYTGPINYTPGTNAVTGTLLLTQTGNPANLLGGPFQYDKTVIDPFNELEFDTASVWTNSAGNTLTFYGGYVQTLYRDTSRLTNYWGGLTFNDGDPSTGEEDYWEWMLSIDDMNDQDSDTIPDFSDNPPSQYVPPRAPAVTLLRNGPDLILRISGDTNRLHDIEACSPLAAWNWTPVSSVTLTNDPQDVPLSAPTPGTFWRVVAH